MFYYIITKSMPENSFVKVSAKTRVASINCFIENYHDDLNMIAINKKPSKHDIEGNNIMGQFGKTLKANKKHYEIAHPFSNHRSNMVSR